MSKASVLTADQERSLIKMAKTKKFTKAEMADKLGVSRNTVCGKLFRLAKAGKVPAPPPKPEKSKGFRFTRPDGQKKPPTVVRSKLDLPPLGPQNDFPAHGTCQFISGDVKTEWRCCGRKTVPAMPWCVDHLRVVYDPTATARIANMQKKFSP